jgi:signal transduction histidine kinase/ActR/RegA family two-component response regulator
MSFLTKTVLGVACIEALLLLLLLISSNHSLERSFVEGLHTRANSTVALLDTTARDAIFSKDLATLESFVQHAISNPDVAFIRIQETSGTVLAEAGDRYYLDQQVLRAPDTMESSLEDGVYDAQVAVTEGGRTYAFIEIGLSTQYAEGAKRAARNRNLSIAATELILVALFSILLGRYLTRELLRLKTAATAIARGEFGFQVPVSGNDEIADTLRSFNEMSLQVQRYHLQQKASERREFEGKNRLAGILSTISEGVVLLNANMVVEYANPIGHSFLEFLCGNPQSAITEIGSVPIQDLLTPSRPPTQELTMSIQGSERIFEFSAALVDHHEPIMEWVIILRDVTQSRQSLEKAKKQARLAALGQLSAGIAHDFNNILSVIIGISDLNLSRTDEEIDDELRQDLTCIFEQGQRASELVRHVLNFSHRERTLQSSPIELNSFLSSLTSLIERTTATSISIDFTQVPEPLWIRHSTTQLQQIVTNIIMNAIDALHHDGTVVLKLDKRVRAESRDAGQSTSWICLSISDDGDGIKDKDLPHIFEPFYTTKALGKGTGLGLAQAYEDMQNHDGKLEVQSQIGEGTCFTLFFNEMEFESEELMTYHETSGTTERTLLNFQGKQILLVDDDPQVRKAIKAMLIRLGCIVLEANNGQKGIEVFRHHQTTLHAILSDVIMPEMGGAEMVVTLRQKENCTIPIALISGYIPENEVDIKQLKSHIDGFTCKPIQFETLAGLLQQLFESSHSNSTHETSFPTN